MKAAVAKNGLSHDIIVTAALKLIDKSGLEDFSTRKLGRALGCEAMALYYYFPSKDALLDGVVDKLVEHLGLDTANITDWVSAMREVARAYRRVAHDHPRAFPLLATRRFAGERSYTFLEQLFTLSRQAGIDDKTSARYYRTISSYCNGFGLNELATQPGGNAALRKKFPRVAAVSTYLEPKYLDEMFEFGLELHLEALRREIKSS